MVNSHTGCFPSAYLGAVHPMPGTGINDQLKAALTIAYFQNREQRFGRKSKIIKKKYRLGSLLVLDSTTNPATMRSLVWETITIVS